MSAKPLHVLLVITKGEIGGAQTHVIELCRALRVDPKVARRERFKQQGARRTGLFAKKRPGAAAGY